MTVDLRHDLGPFDVIGDVHGCAAELQSLLAALDYSVTWTGDGSARQVTVKAPPGRKAIFVGDLVDRGPASPSVLRLVMSMAAGGGAYVVNGNHDRKLARWLAGRKVTVSNGLQETIDQLGYEDDAFRQQVRGFLEGLPSHLWLDGGRLVVVHAGLRDDMVGRDSAAVRAFAMFGDTTGALDGDGLPVTRDWTSNHRAPGAIVYGHIATVAPEWINDTVCVDTGCVYGGRLTALRWPERSFVAVSAERPYFPARRPFGGPPSTTPEAVGGVQP